MATNFSDFGGRGGLPTPFGGGGVPTVAQPRQIASRDIGDIIVRSLETVTESLGRDKVPVSYEDVVKAVSEGINKSILGKGMKGGKGMGGITVSSSTESDKYFQQKRLMEYQNWLKKEANEEKKKREERTVNWNKAVDKTFQELSTWTENPLKGFSNLIDNSIKGLFKGIEKASSTTLGTALSKIPFLGNKFKQESPDQLVKDEINNLGNSISPQTSSGGESKGDVIDQLLVDDETQIEQQAIVVETTSHIQDALDQLLVDDVEEDKEKKKEQEEKEQDKKKEEKKSTILQASIGEIGTKVALGVLTVVGIAALLPVVIGEISGLLAKIPANQIITQAKVENLLTGPYSIGKQIEIGLRKAGASILRAMGNESLARKLETVTTGGISGELLEEYRNLELKKGQLDARNNDLRAAQGDLARVRSELGLSPEITDERLEEIMNLGTREKHDALSRLRISEGREQNTFLKKAGEWKQIKDKVREYESLAVMTEEELERMAEIKRIQDESSISMSLDDYAEQLKSESAENLNDIILRKAKNNVTEFQAEQLEAKTGIDKSQFGRFKDATSLEGAFTRGREYEGAWKDMGINIANNIFNTKRYAVSPVGM